MCFDSDLRLTNAGAKGVILRNVKYVVCAMMVVFCSSAYAKLKIENAFLLSPGMNKKEVLDTMGSRPVASEFTGELEEWHFCKAHWNIEYDYVSVFFMAGKVIAMKQYGVRNKRTTCASSIKGGSYKEPDVVKEYRLKFR